MMKNSNTDIFDKIMMLPILRIFRPTYIKYKEEILYIFFGGLSFVVSIGTFAIMEGILNGNELVSNIISWIVTVIFVFLTNKIWVFKSIEKENWFRQLRMFLGGRIITLLLEEIILFIFITIMNFSSIIIKIVAQIVVIVSNYFISKRYVFK